MSILSGRRRSRRRRGRQSGVSSYCSLLSSPPLSTSPSFSLTRFRSSQARQAGLNIHNGDIIRVHQPHSITKLPEPAPLRDPSLHTRLRLSMANGASFLWIASSQILHAIKAARNPLPICFSSIESPSFDDSQQSNHNHLKQKANHFGTCSMLRT